jgi:hypothetical protein
MPSTAIKRLLAAILFAVISAAAAASGSSRPPRFLPDPVLGLRLEVAGLKLDSLPEDIRAICGQIADDERWTGRVWIFGQAKDAGSIYYVLGGYFKRRHPEPGERLYDLNGGVYTIRGAKCGGDDAREVFDVRDFNDTPQPIMEQLAHDLAARLVRAFGGADRLRSEIKNQRIDFDQLSPELQEAFKLYFPPMK